MTGIADGIVLAGRYPVRLLIVAVLAVAGASLAQAAWKDYKPATLAAAIERYAEASEESEDDSKEDNYALFPGEALLVDVVFTGRMRALPEDRRLVIEFWAKTYGIDLVAIRNYEKEIEVREDGRTYWLPIQKILVPPLRKEVGKNGRANMYARFIGRKNKDYVFLVNEFDGR